MYLQSILRCSLSITLSCILLSGNQTQARDRNTVKSPSTAHPLPFGEVIPEGWLANQLREDLTTGITGNFPTINPTSEHRRFILHNARPDNVPHQANDDQQQGWWSGEHEAYYADGYFRSAWLAADQLHKTKATDRLKAILAAQDSDGYIGIYARPYRLPQTGPDGELWTQSRIFQALLAYYEATKDKSVLQAVEKAVQVTMSHYSKIGYFSRPGSNDGGVSHGVGYFQTLEWLFRLTGDTYYKEAFLRLYRDYAKGDTRDLDMTPTNLAARTTPWIAHTPHTAEGLAIPLIAYAYGDTSYKQAAENVEFKINKYSNPSGGMVGDESILGRPGSFDLPAEYCSYTEVIESMNRMDIYQHPFKLADRIERIAFNGAQGARLHPASAAVAYLSKDNRYQVQRAGPHGDRYLFAPCHTAASCCALNSTRLLPYYIDGMWMKSNNGKTVFARLYGACQVNTVIGKTKVSIRETTDYPFSGKVSFAVSPESPATFKLALRIPTYITSAPTVSVTSGNLKVTRQEGIIEIEGRWKAGDIVELNLPFTVRRVTDSKGTTGIAYGPLLFSLPIEAKETKVKTYGDSRFSAREYTPLLPVDTSLKLPSQAEFKVKIFDNGELNDPWSFPPFGLSGHLLDSADHMLPVTLHPLSSTILRQSGFPVCQ